MMTEPPRPPGPAGPPWATGAKPSVGPPREGGRGLAALAGVVAGVGGILSVAGTLLPVTTWGDNSQPPFVIFPILGAAASNAFNEFTWFALEPIGIGAAAGLLGFSLLLLGVPRTAGGGALVAFGLTTLLAFSAYALSSVFTESFGAAYGPMPGPGSWLGIGSGLVLVLAGSIALVAGTRRRG
jgi:hypothetical protein